MKIAFTSDNHIQICDSGEDLLESMIKEVKDYSPEVFCVLGDMGEGMKPMIGGPSSAYETLLGSLDPTLFVLGNHDLYKSGHKKTTPDISMADHLNLLYIDGIPLEKSWEDTETVFTKDDHSFVGTIGFCDFSYPGLRPAKWFELRENQTTIDTRHIKLDGWKEWTNKLNKAFYKRLDKAVQNKPKQVIVMTHYPCFPTHSKIDVLDRVWPFFYNYNLGKHIQEVAKKNPDIIFWCLAGHSHEYCRGEWGMEAGNLYAHGFRTDYWTQNWLGFDTEADPIKNRDH